MRLIEQLGKAFVELLSHILTPQNFGLIATLVGLSYRGFISLRKILEKQQDELITSMNKRLSLLEETNIMDHRTLEKEILRLQLLNGMDSNRLSKSEVLFFYDKYTAVGGNSFVQEKVQSYLRMLEQQDKYPFPFMKEVNKDDDKRNH